MFYYTGGDTMSRILMPRERLLAAVRDKLSQHGYKGLSDLPVDPFAIAEREGIRVEKRPLVGMTGLLFSGGLFTEIVLDENSPARWTFTLAHELIHYWFHPAGTYCESYDNTKSIYEIQANYAAAEALMPADAVRIVAPELDYDVALLAHAFGVSKQAMEIRLRELRLPT